VFLDDQCSLYAIILCLSNCWCIWWNEHGHIHTCYFLAGNGLPDIRGYPADTDTGRKFYPQALVDMNKHQRRGYAGGWVTHTLPDPLPSLGAPAAHGLVRIVRQLPGPRTSVPAHRRPCDRARASEDLSSSASSRDVIWFGKYPSGSGFEDGEHWFG
jgi:hypothetical protein